MSTFFLTSCTGQNETQKPTVWDSSLIIENENNDIDIYLTGSLDAGLIRLDLETHTNIDDLQPIGFTEILNILLFNSIRIDQSLRCNLIEEKCIVCILAPLIWPSEICFD